MKLTSLVLLFSSLLHSQVIRVNAGGPSYVDSGGATWEADNYFSGGTAFTSIISSGSITGTSDPTLYMTGRTDPSAFSYSFPLADGIYKVTLKFAEVLPIISTGRYFNVVIGTQTVLSGFNITNIAGRGAAYDRSFNVAVLGNSPLNIIFSQVSGAPIIQAIEVLYMYSVPTGATLPSTCSLGQLFYKTTATIGTYICTAVPGTWTALGSGSGSVSVVGSGNLASTACVTGGGTQLIQTPNAACTIDASGNISTPGSITSGNAGGTAGATTWSGVTGSATVGVANTAGSPNRLNWPVSTASPGYYIKSDGGNPQQLSYGIIMASVLGTISTNSANPVDSTTYFWSSTILSTTACASAPNYYSLIAPATGTITDLYATARIFGTLGTTEAVTYTLMKNCVATTLTMTQTWDAADPALASDLAHSVAITKGDLLQLRVVTPAWATNPTTVQVGPWSVGIVQ